MYHKYVSAIISTHHHSFETLKCETFGIYPYPPPVNARTQTSLPIHPPCKHKHKCPACIRKSHLDLEQFRELQYFQRSHGALGASGCLSKIDIFLGVFGYLSEMAQRCIFTWVSLDIFERSLKHLSKIFQRCIVPWVSPGGFQISFRHVYLLECL